MYDVVLYGATGFTGGFAAQYLAEHPQKPRIAFAGRNMAKVRKVRDSLVNVSKERIESIDLIEASADDKESLRRMASSAKAVINAVGPYSLLGGFDVAQAVAEAGGGYVDLTGESNVFERYAKELTPVAQQTKAVLVPSSGFDCLPFDLTTYFAVQEVKKKLGPDSNIDRVVCGYDIGGSVSGGTLASMVNKDPEALNFTRPYWLSPVQGTMTTKIINALPLPQFRKKSGAFTFLTAHNLRVVNRSWGLLQDAQSPHRYGPTFQYLEGVTRPSKLAACIASSVVRLIVWLLLHVSLFGKLLMRTVPQGTGAPMEKQLQGFLNMRTVAYGSDGRTKGLAVMKVKGDPGYLKTGAFISEVALAIALDRERLSPLGQKGGVLTPATVGADVVVERLAQYGGGISLQAADATQEDLTQLLAYRQVCGAVPRRASPGAAHCLCRPQCVQGAHSARQPRERVQRAYREHWADRGIGGRQGKSAAPRCRGQGRDQHRRSFWPAGRV